MNKRTHKSLSRFRSHHGGNTPTSSRMILSENKCYKVWAECSSGSHVKGGLGLMSSARRVGVLL
jgi:hypothetical protein